MVRTVSHRRLKSILDSFASLSCSYMEITTFKNIYFGSHSGKNTLNNSDVQFVKSQCQILPLWDKLLEN